MYVRICGCWCEGDANNNNKHEREQGVKKQRTRKKEGKGHEEKVRQGKLFITQKRSTKGLWNCKTTTMGGA